MFRILLLVLPALFVSACGSSSGDANSSTSDVAIRFSDAPVDDVNQVVITVDSMTFRHSAGKEIMVDTFTSAELGLNDADTFTIDLLEIQGSDNRLVLDSVDLPVGDYVDLRLDILDQDTSLSYVIEADNAEPKNLKVPSGELKLGAFTVSALSTQTFVIEFGLRQSLTYNPGPDRYILKPRGVRIVELEAASAIAGTIDLVTTHATAPCDTKSDVDIGNVVYVYSGHGLNIDRLTDNADPDVDNSIETEGLVVPLASAALNETSTFDIAYLPAGDYTVAFSCLAEEDEPDTVENIAIPAPDTDIVELTLVAGERANCDFVSGTVPDCTVSAAESEIQAD